MSPKTDLLCRFSGDASTDPLYIPDLTLWYNWHHSRGSLPDRWKDYSLLQIAASLGVSAWQVVRPWRIETPGVEIRTTEEEGQRTTHFETAAGSLTARWSLGADGTWWQIEYPVKTAADLEVALELVRARLYVLEKDVLSDAGEQGIAAIEIPGCPYTDLLYEFVGLSEGFMLVIENPPAMQQLLALLETKLQELMQQLAPLPGSIFFAPDNLDSQFISPETFGQFLAPSYLHTATTLHQHGKYLLVHTGGPIRSLLAPLAAAGVDGVEGIAGKPQSDASPGPARETAGPDFTLWGGIPQDFLLDTHDRQEFEAAVVQAAREARGDRRFILGVADRVPVAAELSRLEAIPALLESVSGQCA